jgi:hypothetical protein
MRGGATEANETQKWARSKKRLRTTGLRDEFINNITVHEGTVLCVQASYFLLRKSFETIAL